MKFKIIYTVFSLITLAFLFISSSGGRAATQNWGNTGAPGDQELSSGSPRTCVSCHNNSASLQVTLDINVLDMDGNNVNDVGYIPGQTYEVEVRINAAMGSPAAYGFQILCLNAEEGVDGAEVSEWSNPSANAQIATAGNTGRTYVEQLGSSDSNVFTADWVAPEAGSGIVTFYSCGNGVNDNMMNSGDGAACNTLSLTENLDVATEEPKAVENLAVYPNPFSTEFNISFDLEEASSFEINLYNSNGQRILFEKQQLNSGNNNLSFTNSDLPEGIYFVELRSEAGVSRTKLLKL